MKANQKILKVSVADKNGLLLDKGTVKNPDPMTPAQLLSDYPEGSIITLQQVDRANV